jgi:cobyric acid synthase
MASEFERTRLIIGMFLAHAGKPEGMRLGNVYGTYLHGILRSEKARVELLVPDKDAFPSLKNPQPVEDPLDKFAQHLESCGLTFQRLQDMINRRGSQIKE